MTEYAADTDGATVCVDCLHGACISYGPCGAEECRCECGRARDLDDRPAEKLASIARDIELEARAWPDQLHRERFPDHRELLAERTRRTA